jgi:ABC-type multidrug transport system ATPase subunit
VAQDDILLPFLTVEETLFYSAQLRVAGSRESRKRLVCPLPLIVQPTNQPID